MSARPIRNWPLPLALIVLSAAGLAAGTALRGLIRPPAEPPLQVITMVQLGDIELTRAEQAQDPAQAHESPRAQARYRLTLVNEGAEVIVLSEVLREVGLGQRPLVGDGLPLRVAAGDTGVVELQAPVECGPSTLEQFTVRLARAGDASSVPRTELAQPVGVLASAGGCYLASSRLPGGWLSPLSGAVMAQGPQAQEGLDIEVEAAANEVSPSAAAITAEVAFAAPVITIDVALDSASNRYLVRLRPKPSERCYNTFIAATQIPTGLTLRFSDGQAERYLSVGPELARWLDHQLRAACPGLYDQVGRR